MTGQITDYRENCSERVGTASLDTTTRANNRWTRGKTNKRRTVPELDVEQVMRADISINRQLDGPIPKFLAKALELSDFHSGVPYRVFYRPPPNSSGQ